MKNSSIKSILFIDNYDSYTYNLVNLFKEILLDVDIQVIRNQDPRIKYLQSDVLVLSPGPMNPQKSGYCQQALENHLSKIVIGICLGFQIINEFFGGETKKSFSPCHGKVVEIIHNNHSFAYKNIPKKLKVMRYNSLQSVNIPEILAIDAVDNNQEIMSFYHQDLLIYGFQYHIESFLTFYGKTILSNIFNHFITNKN